MVTKSGAKRFSLVSERTVPFLYFVTTISWQRVICLHIQKNKDKSFVLPFSLVVPI